MKTQRAAGSTTLALAVALLPVCPLMAGQELPRDEAGVGQAFAALEELSKAGLQFETYQTPNYTIIHSGERQMAIQRGQLLEKLQRHYFLFLKHVGIEHHRLQRKLVVLVFEQEDEFLQYARADGYASALSDEVYLQGYYSPGTNRAAFFNQRRGGDYERSKQAMQQMAQALQAIPGPKDTPVRVTGPEGPSLSTKGQVARELLRKKEEFIAHFEKENLTVTQHEGAHQLAFNAGLQKRGVAYPFWVSEGLACTFESPGTPKGFGAFRVNSKRLGQYRDAEARGTTKGMKGLVTLPPDSPDNLMDLYAESWALFFFLAKTRPKELSAHLKDLAERTNTTKHDPAAEWALFTKHFDPEGNKLEQRWRLFMRGLR